MGICQEQSSSFHKFLFLAIVEVFHSVEERENLPYFTLKCLYPVISNTVIFLQSII